MVTEQYDIVVVGAGSSGAVVAARASEDPSRSVCLIEAGPDYPDTGATPYDLVNSHVNSLRDTTGDFRTSRRRLAAASPSPAAV